MEESGKKLSKGNIDAKRKIKSYVRYIKYSSMYRQGVVQKGAGNKSEKTVMFIINFPQAWKSVKSLYDEAIKRQDLNVIVLAVPHIGNREDISEDIRSIKNDSFEFFQGTDVNAIKANGDDGKWVNPQDYNPDYVIFIRSYNYYAPELYKSFNVCKYARCFYVPYAYGMLGEKMLLSVLPEDFTFTMHRIYFPNNSRKEAYAKEQPFYRKKITERFKYLGFPRFDFCQTVFEERDYSKRNFTVAWMPRWAAEDKPDQKPSHFLIYYKQFIEYFEKNTDINLIIRPHPLMFSSYINNGTMTEAEVEAFKERCRKAPNIEIDEKKDYSITLNDTDLLVADYTSLIAEFFMMGKPIIFCDTVDGLNYEGDVICGAAYTGYSFDEICKRINSIKDGKDTQKTKRLSLISDLLPARTGEIGKTILEDILNS